MPMMTIQVVIPASGKAQVSNFLPPNFVGQPNILVQWLQFQNNAAHPIRYGDATVSTTVPAAVGGGTAGKGMLLPGGSPGGAGAQSTPIGYSTMISDWYIAGTAGDVIDCMFIP